MLLVDKGNAVDMDPEITAVVRGSTNISSKYMHPFNLNPCISTSSQRRRVPYAEE